MKTITLFKKYNKHSIEDAGSITSDEFKKFASDVKKTLNEICANLEAELHGFRAGHYDLSAFVKKGEKYCYLSFSVPRGEYAMDLTATDPMNGWLCRTAKSLTDYTGGINNFTNILGLEDKIKKLLDA